MSSYDDERYDDESGAVQDAPLRRDPRGATPPYAQQPMQPPGYGMQQPSGYGMQQPSGYGMQQQQWGMRPRRSYPIETKPFFLTSEFVGAVLVILGIAITAASSEAFGAWRAWILITAIAAAYMVSRGIAKSGTRSHSDDPREHLDLNWDRGQKQHSHDGR